MQKALSLSAQVSQYEKELSAKTARIQVLEKKARLIRAIDGTVQCTFSGNWKRHPGSIVPISWNKAETYARMFQANETEAEAILFLLENMSMSKLPDGNLRVNLEIRAKPGVGPLGHEISVLAKYTHLVVYVPFIGVDATVDNRITLKEITGSLYVNGEKKSNLSEAQSFEIPIQVGKAFGFQLNKADLFTGLAE